MSVTVRVGAALRRAFSGQSEVRAEGVTVREVLEGLGVAAELCDASGAIKRHINIHINDGEDVRFHGGLDCPVGRDDVLTIIAAISGG